ncbi:Hypothetical predicted protein [Pelobates cultripes]|uniref:exodeoxyribonuclease III n=1 Tax=Pelobates cultripes TaxID=61616 RepID=A0AAD1RIZ9_PELCU|nr:Hypothetical predicted protein [Pelobates cultripes]
MPEPYQDLKLFTDLSAATLQFRKSLTPLTTTLRSQGIAYRWGYPAKLLIHYRDTLHAVDSLAADTKTKGVSIFIHKEVTFTLQRHFINLQGLFNATQYTLVTAYLPNDNPKKYLQSLLTKIDQYRHGNLLICGDFNLSQTSLDSSSQKGNRALQAQDMTHKHVSKILSLHDLYDVWRTLNPGDRDYTFYSRVHNSYSCTDAFFVDRVTLPHVSECKIGEITWSDHSPVTLDLKDEFQFRGKGTWRLNDSLLHNEKFVATIREELTAYFKLKTTPDITESTAWSAHKAVLRGLFIKQAAHIKRLHNSAILDCHAQIAQLSALNKTQPLTDIATQLSHQYNKLRELNAEKTRRLLHKLKADTYHHSGKATRLLAARLHNKCNSQKIANLLNEKERSFLNPYALANLMWLPKKHRPPLTHSSDLITLRLQMWDRHRATLSSKTTLSPATPIAALPYCIPTFHARPWLDKKLTHIYQVLQQGELIDFAKLRDIHGLPQTSHFSHMQLRSFLCKLTNVETRSDSVKEQITGWEQICINEVLPPLCKLISMCYRLLANCLLFPTTKIAKQWTTDLG